MATQNESQTVRKRKRHSLKQSERKKVSRACDACKEKKVRCAGTQPCARCVSQSLQCQYNSEHRRGKPAAPQPGIPISFTHSPSLVSTPGSQRNDQEVIPSRSASSQILTARGFAGRLQSSQEAEGPRFDDDYIGPTSGIAFLYRAQRRFQQGLIESPSGIVGNQASSKASIFTYGDETNSENDSLFIFPSRKDANHLLERYFDFAMPTYRYIHRKTVEEWLETMCTFYETTLCQNHTLSSAKRAIVILILATAKLYDGENTIDTEISDSLYKEAEKILADETGPVRLESVQARLAQCMYLLSASRINQSWYIFGTACQLVLALGLHRQNYRHPVNTNSEVILEYRKRVFWSAYTLDRYLSVILGRPRVFRDEEIDQSFPGEVNDTRLEASVTGNKSKLVQRLLESDGPIFHARLAKIVGGISNDLYPTHRPAETQWMESAQRWTAELKSWKESLPAFLNPSKVDPSMLIPIFERQSTVLRLGYAHALILANRPSLLNNFADLSQRPIAPVGAAHGSLKECIEAAMVVVETVIGLIDEGGMRKSYWFTHYISFCAISALYVYTIQQCPVHHPPDTQYRDSDLPPDLTLFNAAKRCQQRLAETTTRSSPFGRYNIILDELKNEVFQELGLAATLNQGLETIHQDRSRDAAAERAQNDTVSRQYEATSSQGHSLDYGLSSEEHMHSLPIEQLPRQLFVQNRYQMNATHVFDDPLTGTSFPGGQGELLGWSEFDSCALAWPDYAVFDQMSEL